MSQAIRSLPRALFTALALALAGTCSGAPAAEGRHALFDPQARREALARGEFVQAQAACLTVPRDVRWARMPLPQGLKGTDDPASETSSTALTWALMILAGRSLAGDAASEADLVELLRRSAIENAFSVAEPSEDSELQLKRSLVAIIVSYGVVRDRIDQPTRELVNRWLDPLVRDPDRRFAGVGSEDQQGYLSDVVSMLWGNLAGDRALYETGLQRYRAALAKARADGSLPLQARRGARAAWHHQSALASLTLLAEAAAANGDDLYGLEIDGRSLDLVVGHLVNVITAPAIGRAYAAANQDSGTAADPGVMDLSFLDRRFAGRHLMAFSEALMARNSQKRIGQRRLEALLLSRSAAARPLIDEFSGGNATCFWLQK
jgi:poly(beta-D-mannuronate) lyase